MDIAVVDYGMGNLRSVAKALVHVAPTRSIVVTSDPDAIRRAGRVVLPGQSAMPDCIKGLRESGLTEVVVEAATSRPFLGICLGLQMLFESSEEGPTQGLGVLAGRVIRFRDNAMALADGQRLKVPHMGWSPVRQSPVASVVDGHSRSDALLLRAQLSSRSGRSRGHRRNRRLSGGVYLRDCPG